MLHDNFGSIVVTSPLDIPSMWDLRVLKSEVRVRVDSDFPFLCVCLCCGDEHFCGALGMFSGGGLEAGVDSWTFGILGTGASFFSIWGGLHVFGMLCNFESKQVSCQQLSLNLDSVYSRNVHALFYL